MNEDNDTEIVLLAEKIKRYLANNPKSADTLEGVANWWLRDTSKTDMGLVKRALDSLVKEQVVIKIVNRDGNEIYRSSLATQNRQ